MIAGLLRRVFTTAGDPPPSSPPTIEERLLDMSELLARARDRHQAAIGRATLAQDRFSRAGDRLP